MSRIPILALPTLAVIIVVVLLIFIEPSEPTLTPSPTVFGGTPTVEVTQTIECTGFVAEAEYIIVTCDVP